MIALYVTIALVLLGLAASVRILSNTSAECSSGWDGSRTARAALG